VSKFTLHRNPLFSLQSENAIIRKSDVTMVGTAAEMLDRIQEVSNQYEQEITGAKFAGQQEGFAAGYQAGVDAGFGEGQSRTAQHIRKLDEALAVEHHFRREYVQTLSLAIVRRIAARIGEGPMISAMVEGVLNELDPKRPIKVRVSQDAFDQLNGELQVATHNITLVIDDNLGPFDCEVDSGGATLELGVNSQLNTVSDALQQQLDALISQADFPPYDLDEGHVSP
jgi:flagellar biosynthesis/type III secretory pathway protein FliH